MLWSVETAVKTVYPLTSIAWPFCALRYRLTEFEYFFEIIRWQVTTFQMIAGSSSIIVKCMWNHVMGSWWNKLCSWAAPLKSLISNWPRTQKFMQGRQSLLTFLIMVTRWSRSSFNFYALIGQNLTGEFMQKMYAASRNLFSDSWSWQFRVANLSRL